MADGPATTTYSIPEPFDEAVRSLRRVLAEAGLKITGELDLSGRLQRRLLVDTPPCLVVFAGPATPVLNGLLSDHFTWAKRGLDWARRKWQRLRAN